jgi:hypothetical protein
MTNSHKECTKLVVQIDCKFGTRGKGFGRVGKPEKNWFWGSGAGAKVLAGELEAKVTIRVWEGGWGGVQLGSVIQGRPS